MLRFYISAFFQKDNRIIKWPRQKKLELELKSFMEKMTITKMSLNKLEILIIILSKKLKEFVSKTFCKSKIQLKRLSS